MNKLKRTLGLIKKAAFNWSDDDLSVHGAALAYYTVFSVAPLLVIAIAIAGFVFGGEASSGKIFTEIQGLVGSDGAQAIQGLVHSAANKPHAGLVATIIGVVTLVVGASGVFTQLQDSLNTIWHVKTAPGKGLWVLVRRRLLSFSMIVVIGFILLVSLLVGAIVSAAGELVQNRIPGGEAIWQVINSTVSFGVTTLLFAAVLKVLPDVRLRWRDVWVGSVVTAVLFTVGKLLIGLYIGHSGVASSFGAAGSLVIVLVWVFYAAQIIYFGAELTRAILLERGATIAVKDGATFDDALEAKSAAKAEERKAA